MLKLCENEIEIMTKINHHWILKLYEYFVEDKKSITLITQFCDGGTLEDFLIQNKFNFPEGLTEEKALYFLREIAEGFMEM